jgi:transposase
MGFLWCLTRIWFRAPSGRQRFNILGALNAVTFEVITVCNATYIDSWSVVELLFKLRAKAREMGRPVSIVLDNAPYQACWLVKNVARLLSIDLVFLPSYSPNLNLIERLWKFVRKKCCHSTPCDNFKEFCSTLQVCAEQGYIHYSEELRSLLTWRFQTFPSPKEKVA